MFHSTTTVGAGRLANMASATHSVKSHRMEGKEDAEDVREDSRMFILTKCTSMYILLNVH